MEQARFEELLSNFQTQCSTEHTIFDLSAVAGQIDAPIVLLVHGIGGNFRHWADPVSMNVNDTWLFDIHAKPAKGAKGIVSSPPYQAGAVTSWTQFLANNHISYVNFSQAKPGDLLDSAVQEVAGILSSLEKLVFEPYEQDVAANGGAVPPLIIVCHSRGGLVTRAALKQLGSAGVPHLRKVITLSTPHHGSFMPKLANDYNNLLHTQLDFTSLAHSLPNPIKGFVEHTIGQYLNGLANLVREALMHSFGTPAQSPGFVELMPDSPTLQALAQDEQPLPGVQYYSFGGNEPTFVNFFLSVMGQSVHVLATASQWLIEALGRIPGVHDEFGGLAEMNQGDSAVSVTSSHWPEAFAAPHADFKINHMQVLIDRPLQEAVLNIIRT